MNLTDFVSGNGTFVKQAQLDSHVNADDPHNGYVLKSDVIDQLPMGSVIQEAEDTVTSNITSTSTTNVEIFSIDFTCLKSTSLIKITITPGRLWDLQYDSGASEADGNIYGFLKLDNDSDSVVIHDDFFMRVQGRTDTNGISRLMSASPLVVFYVPGTTATKTYKAYIRLGGGDSFGLYSDTGTNASKMRIEEIKQ